VFDELSLDSTTDKRLAASAAVETAIQKASAEIYDLASEDTTKRGMGTTFVCLVVAGSKGVIGHVGDSRVYLLRAGQCHRLTEDHTLVAAQIKAGTISKKQANSAQYRNVITRAVGIQESVQVDTLIVDIMPGDEFILCSDGLHGYFENGEMISLARSIPPADLPKRLVDWANQQGGRDNVTVVVVSVEPETAGVIGEEFAEAQTRIEALRNIPLFKHLTYKERTAILSIASTVTIPSGQEIVTEGLVGDQLFVVVRGRVSVEKRGVSIAELKSGGHFGEMGLVDNEPRSATVRAVEPTRVMVITRLELMNLMRKEPVLAVKMLWSFVQVLSDRLRATNAELSEIRQGRELSQPAAPFGEE
jgi:serine/threonine protein phosphatase PrpC